VRDGSEVTANHERAHPLSDEVLFGRLPALQARGLAGPPLLFISMLSINLVLREPQDAVLRTASQDEVCGDQLYPSDLMSFMESIHQIILNSDLFGAHDPEFIVPDGAGNKLLGR
jgi:hypothetical protein